MPERPFTPNAVEDALADFSAGINQGIAPHLLPPNQLGNALNATMRGDFALNRPPFNIMELNFLGDTDLQDTFETGLYQGCSYYKDRYGNPYLVAQISGRMLLFTPIGNGFNVTEITIAGDPNNATTPQAWIWQAEEFLIAQDGESAPFIYDGTTSRRAQQGVVLLGTTATSAFNVPAIGASITVTLAAPYTGPFNILVAVYNAATTFLGYFQTVEASGGTPTYTVQLTNNSGAAQNVAIDDQIIVPGSSGTTNRIGILNQTAQVPGNGGSVVAHLSNPVPANISTGGAGGQGSIYDNPPQIPPGFGARCNAPIGSTNVTITSVIGSPGFTLQAGDQLYFKYGTNTPPTSSYPVASLAAAYSFAVGETKTVLLKDPYTGPSGQAVTINGKAYTIQNPATQVPVASVTLLNISAVPGANLITIGSTIKTVPELPPGRMGVYGLGRNWLALTDGKSFVASDQVGGSSGTPAYNKRDSVLRFQENTYLAGGGAFVVPSSAGEIAAMQFVTILDASLGQGPLMVHTPDVVFSCIAGQNTDRTSWQDVTNPILTEAYKPQGGLSQRSTLNVNGDSIYRAVDGIRSLILARKDFDVWGNVPASFEVDPLLRLDDQSLLQFSSAIVFDNRVLMTASPVQGPTGVYHPNIIALNLDPISSLRGKQPAIYDGVWQRLNVLHLVTGRFNAADRGFAFTYNTVTEKNELWEILQSTSPQSADNGTERIIMDLQFPVLYFGNTQRPVRTLLRLLDGELYVDQLAAPVNQNTVTFEAFFRADYESTWHPWRTWTISAAPPWQSRMGLGEPPSTSDLLTNRPWREGYTFQMRLRVTGHCILKGARFRATTIPESAFAPIPKSV